MDQHSNMKALITGGSRGIGRAIVDRLASSGFDIVFTWNNNQEAADNVVKELRQRGHQVRAIQADLSTVKSAEHAAQQLRMEGPFKILVNNATIASPIGPVVDTHLDAWTQALTVSATAPFLLIKYLAPHMIKGGAIINISSLNTVMPQAGIAGYCAGKSALESLTQVVAKELASQGITVNAVRPGVTDTDGQRTVNPDPEVRNQIAQMTPMGRLGMPSDIADVVAFLAGSDSRWVTGQSLTVSGGL